MEFCVNFSVHHHVEGYEMVIAVADNPNGRFLLSE